MSDPLLAASVVLLRHGGHGPEVLLLERHTRSDVHGGVHVFPGGKVEPFDGPPDAAHEIRMRHAAVRELKEECGVVLSIGDLTPFSRWITPVKSVSPKRFDTWFFLAELPPGQEAVADQVEAVSLLWTTPAQALRRYWDDDIKLAPPQIMSLVGLAGHARIADILADAGSREPPEVMPEHIGQGDDRVVAFPGDPMHSRTLRAMPGPLRLYFRNGRYEPQGGFGDFGIR